MLNIFFFCIRDYVDCSVRGDISKLTFKVVGGGGGGGGGIYLVNGYYVLFKI